LLVLALARQRRPETAGSTPDAMAILCRTDGGFWAP
jgi:hypothetical protein